MRVHVLGIAGTFMAGLAVMAKQAGYEVSGSDEKIYPPMSDVLADAGIAVIEGYNELPASVLGGIDEVIIGNVLSRGNSALESVLNSGLPYYSGPQWLYERVLSRRRVCAVAGTHGKTTTTSMITWILECAGLNPGYLIGGAPKNFDSSARYTDSDFFVIEADEYDTAFFDKRPKFLHYRPKTLVLNNLEFDHADIYKDLEAIKQQFHYLLRSVPAKGGLIINNDDAHFDTVLQRGCWSRQTRFSIKDNTNWHAIKRSVDGSVFECLHQGQSIGEVKWSQIGDYNLSNALAAAAAAFDLGVSYEAILQGLSTFSGVAKRMDLVADGRGIKVFRDFAHHPTAIAGVIQALFNQTDTGRVIVMLELGSRTMQRHVDVAALALSLEQADQVFVLDSKEIEWSLDDLKTQLTKPLVILQNVQEGLELCKAMWRAQDRVLLLSNKNFAGIAEGFKSIL
jgi:UDP-N-acetylmuramate: L-alanyl-gamma-D-glutamyl-meso-diaminopimelate ligase